MKPSVKLDDRKARRLLKRLAERVEDMRPVMADVADEMHASVEKTFLAGGRPRWKPLADATKAQREEAGKWPGQILVRSAQLKNSLHAFSGKDYAGVGTNKKYAATHQFGAKKGEYGTRKVSQKVRAHSRNTKSGAVKVRAHTRTATVRTPWGDVPARPFMDIPDEDVRKLIDTIRAYLYDDG